MDSARRGVVTVINRLYPDENHHCELHGVHVPEPLILHRHHIVPLEFQHLTGVRVPDDNNLLTVCPTGHYNIHELISRLRRGEVRRGRRGPTGRFALEAILFLKDNPPIRGETVSLESITDDLPDADRVVSAYFRQFFPGDK